MGKESKKGVDLCQKPEKPQRALWGWSKKPLKMAKNTKNGQKWPKIAKNGQKWPKMAKNGQKWPKW